MLIRHLRFFVKLAEEQHFGRAADLCNVTQPTLSQAIRKLEGDLGLSLIVRAHRFMSLTPEGEKVLKWGRQILADYDSLHDGLAGRKKQGLSGKLRLGVIPAAMPAVSFLTDQFSSRNPLASMDVRSMTSRAIQKGLDNFDIDGGITYLDNEALENVRCFPLYHERYVFAGHAGHPLMKSDTVNWAQAIAQPLCMLSDDMQNRRILNGIAMMAGVELHPAIVSNSFLGVASHLRSGRWCAIVPHSFRYLFGDDPNLAMRDMGSPDHRQTIGLVLSDRALPSPMALALQDCVSSVEVTRRLEAAFGESVPEPSPMRDRIGIVAGHR